MIMIEALTQRDKALLEGLLAADSQSVQMIYQDCLSGVIAWVKENNGNEADARDLFQEGLLALFRRLEKGDFKLTCSLKSYLRVVCRNLWLTRLRNHKRVGKLTEEEELVELDDSIQYHIEKSEQHQLFRKHFDELEAGCRQILGLFFDKIPLSEIAKQLDTTAGYIKKRKFICKERLIEKIQNDPLFQELNN